MRSSGKRTSRWRRILGVSVAVLVLLVLAAAFLAWQPALLLRAGLWLTAQDQIAFDDLQIGLNGLELSGVRIGDPPEHRLARLRVGYQLRRLMRGRAEEIIVDGLVVRGELDRDGLRLAGIDGAATGEPPQLPLLPIPERIAVEGARLELATPLGALLVPFAAELRSEQDRILITLTVDQALLAAAEGQLSLDLDLEGETRLALVQIAVQPERLGDALTASGRIDAAADALGLPDLAHGIEGRARVAFVFERGQLDASLADLHLTLAQLAPEWSAIADLLPPPWRIGLTQPAGLSARLQDRAIVLESTGSATLASAGPRLRTHASASLTLDPDGAVRELVVADGEVGLSDLGVGGMRLEQGSIRLDGSGTPASWQGDLTLELHGGGEPRSGLLLEGARAEAALDAGFAGGRLSLRVREPGALQIAQVTLADQARLSDLGLRWDNGAEPLLTVDVADDGMPWRQRLSAKVPQLQATIQAEGAPVTLTAEVGQLNIELAGDGAAVDGGRFTLADGAVRLPSYDLRLAGIASEIALAGDGLDLERAIPLAVDSIVHEAKPAWFAPLRLEGSAQPRGDRIEFEALVARRAGGAEVRLVGEHELEGGEGRAEVELSPVDFAPGGLQPGALAPLLADLVEDVAGRLAMDGTVRWGAGSEVAADLDLLVENLALTSGPARIEQVNGVIAIDRLVPLSTSPGQQLAVGLVDFGLPLTDGLLTFRLAPGQLAVEELHWQLAEGRIQATPFTIGSEGLRFTTTLSAEGLSLDQIFALTRLDGLTGKGTMHGTLPITVDGADAVVEGGELVSDRPGWVRYRPGVAPAALGAAGDNVNLLLQALDNFRYKELRLTLDGRTDADMDVGLHISGANPDLYDGYPIEFNLNLEGALGNLLRDSLVGYQIPERIRQRMQGFGR